MNYYSRSQYTIQIRKAWNLQIKDQVYVLLKEIVHFLEVTSVL